MGLCQLQAAVRGLGHPGIHVTAWDPDNVSEANLGRQLFTQDELGQNKAITVITRANIVFGLDWEAVPIAYRPSRAPDILISCVDSKQARATIHERVKHGPDETSQVLREFREAASAEELLVEKGRHILRLHLKDDRFLFEQLA